VPRQPSGLRAVCAVRCAIRQSFPHSFVKRDHDLEHDWPATKKRDERDEQLWNSGQIEHAANHHEHSETLQGCDKAIGEGVFDHRVSVLADAIVPSRADTCDRRGGLQAGSDSPTVAALAGLSAPTKRDLEDLLPQLLSEIGAEPPSEAQALKQVGDDVLRQIVDGEIAPYAGGRKLGALWRRQPHQQERRALWEQFVSVYAIADEIDDDPGSRAHYEQDILRAARARLAAGGFDLAV
jgi:hypothetical protein